MFRILYEDFFYERAFVKMLILRCISAFRV